MNLLSYKSKRWEDLTPKETKEWEDLGEKNKDSSLLDFLFWAKDAKKCYMCKVEFPNGILNKYPYETIPILKMIQGEFLFHLKSTHGIDPGMLKLMLKKVNG